MQIKRFDIRLRDSVLLEKALSNTKFINNERTTYFDIKDGVVNIKYKIFDKYDGVVAGFSTRYGGVSREHLSSMNLSFSRGDDYSNVVENHRRFAGAVGYDVNNLVFSDQIHDANIKIVSKEDAGKGFIKESDIVGVDGLITACKGIPLMTFYADCVPLYVYDPIKNVIGLAHSGWKGTVSRIGYKLVNKLKEEYGSQPGDLVCAIGPSICVDCYEVSSDVAEQFSAVYGEEFIDKILYKKDEQKYQLNLHEACRRNFLLAGVAYDNIAMPDICTCCNKELLFSHRATNGKRGNLAAVMMLK